MTRRQPRLFLAADWGKDTKKRAVYKACVETRRIERLASAGWDLRRLLCIARDEVRAKRAPVVVSLDVVLGVPRPYFAQVRKINRWRDVKHFIDWLALLRDEQKTFWNEVKRGDDWTVTRPFCSVPKGEGQMRAFDQKAGSELLRDVDRRCHSKPPFIVSGIPGSVGSGTRAIWQELVPLLVANKDFKVWPFEGSMDSLLEGSGIIIAENYPGISYTSALRPVLPGPLLKVPKRKDECRATVLALLREADWVRNSRITLPDLSPAQNSEDDFDALLTVAGQLRCALEERPLDDFGMDDPEAEGGMLLTSAVDFQKKAETIGRTRSHECSRIRQGTKPTSGGRDHVCPICGVKVFKGSRSGWDPHVASLARHPTWHPEVADPEERRRLFRQEFPGFFR